MVGTEGPRPVLSLVATDAGAAFYAGQVDRSGGPVLVLGAGDGRIAWELAVRGHQVLAVDPADAFLRAIEERRARQSPEASGRLRVTCADVRSLRLDEHFKVVIAPRNALGLMSTRAELDAALATVRTHLLADGLFLLDLVNSPDCRSPPAPDDRAGQSPTWYRPVFVPHLRERQRARSGAAEARGPRRLRVRRFSVEELDVALRDADLQPLERLGDFDGRAFAPEDPLQIVIARPAPDRPGPDERTVTPRRDPP